MPNVVLEAMATGCPVIATAVQGSVEIVRQGETGLLVPPSDANALTEALCELAADPERRYAMGLRSRQLAEVSHAIDDMVASVQALYLGEWARATSTPRTPIARQRPW